MFSDLKINLLNRITVLQRMKCDYDIFHFKKDTSPPSFCDCKYGYGDKFEGEENGCPELRLVKHILSVMTEEEFKEFVNRSEVKENDKQNI